MSSTDPSPRRPLAITAFSAVNGLGMSTEEVLARFHADESGLGAPPFELPIETFVGAAAALAPLPPEWERYESRAARLAWPAFQEVLPAIRDAVSRYGAGRVAVILGTSVGGLRATEHAYFAWRDEGAIPASFDFERQHDFNGVSELLAKASGVEGPVFTLSTACSSSGKVHASAWRLIRAGIVDAALVGGVDSLCRMTLQGFHGLGVLSENRCRPFSVDRDGINIGEGAAFQLLEPAERFLGEGGAGGEFFLLGAGESTDAHHMSSPHPEGRGAAEAMRRALAHAALDAREVGYVNAHGTATIKNDDAEAIALSTLFGEAVPVASTKGFTGHTLGAAAATEAVFALHGIRTGRVPPTLGLEPRDEKHHVDVRAAGVSRRLDTVLSNSFAFGGSNVSLLFGSRAAAARAWAAAREAEKTSCERVAIRGVALWSPGIGSFADYLARDGAAAGDGPEQPKCGIVGSRQRRGTSRIARMLCEVADQTAKDSGADASNVPTLFASAWGEIDIMVGLLEQIYASDGPLSPMRFKHSVHNAASGLVSIAAKNRSFSSALAAGRQTVDEALHEAFGLLATEAEDVLLIFGEDRLPEPLHRFSPHEGLAVGFHLSRNEDGAKGFLSRAATGPEVQPVVVPERFERNSVVGALRIALALSRGEPGAQHRVAIGEDASVLVSIAEGNA